MRRLTTLCVTTALAAAATPGLAQSDDCVLAAAKRLPNIAGLTPKSSSAFTTSLPEFALRLIAIEGRGRADTAAERITERGHYLFTARQLDQMAGLEANGRGAAAYELFKEAMAPWMRNIEGLRVEVEAVGRRASYNFVCGVTRTGAVLVYPQ